MVQRTEKRVRRREQLVRRTEKVVRRTEIHFGATVRLAESWGFSWCRGGGGGGGIMCVW